MQATTPATQCHKLNKAQPPYPLHVYGAFSIMFQHGQQEGQASLRILGLPCAHPDPSCLRGTLPPTLRPPPTLWRKLKGLRRNAGQWFLYLKGGRGFACWRKDTISDSMKQPAHMCVFIRFSRVRFCDPVDCNRPGSSVHGILQAPLRRQPCG